MKRPSSLAWVSLSAATSATTEISDAGIGLLMPRSCVQEPVSSAGEVVPDVLRFRDWIFDAWSFRPLPVIPRDRHSAGRPEA